MTRTARRRGTRRPVSISSAAPCYFEPVRSSFIGHVTRAARVALLAVTGVTALLLGPLGCGRVPSPLNPARQGSLGIPSRGVLTGATNLAPTDSLHWLRQNDRHWGIPRFAKSIEHAAATVARERPGAVLYVGDLSAPRGGQLLPHLSHRNGRDADLLLYTTTLDGAPVHSPGFVGFDADGLAWDAAHRRYLRFDVERQWLLIKALLQDGDARIQFIFISEVLEAVLLEWARARGDDAEILVRAQEVMLQPHPGGVHDDHVHIRTACSDDEVVQGCEPSGPQRAWMKSTSARAYDRTEDLVLSLLQPITLPTLVARD